MASTDLNRSDGPGAAFIYAPALAEYNYPDSCPFKTSRVVQVRETIHDMGLLRASGVSEVATEPADRETLETFHTARYLDALIAAGKGRHDLDALMMGIGSPDCPGFKGMYDYGALTCGATLAGGRLILGGGARVAFNASGGYHHAGPELAAGFCYVNDIVITCLHLSAAGKRVFFLDVDAHHGDGVQNAFYDRADVMTLSFHESGKTLFPGTGFEDEIGTGAGRGYCANVPLPAGVFDEAYLKAFRSVTVPLVVAYAPDVIVLELGMDGLAGDPLTHMRLTNNTYADVIESVLGFGKPVVATGGGGYHVENTVRGWALAWSVLSGQDAHNENISAGMGGVLLETTDWHGGLRDRELAVGNAERAAVMTAVDETIEKVKANVFPLHGL